MPIKTDSHLSPVDMSYTMAIKGLDHPELLRVIALVSEIASERGESLDLTRLPMPSPPRRRIELR